MARFKMYGLIPEEQEVNTGRGVSESDQRNDGSTLIYETDNEKEARAIQVEGGFIPDTGVNAGKWHVVTRTVDSTRTPEAPTMQTPDAPERP